MIVVPTHEETTMQTRRVVGMMMYLAAATSLAACAQQSASTDKSASDTAGGKGAATTSVVAQGTPATGSSTAARDTSGGTGIGATYEAYLTPDQEPGEEKDTPATTPKQFKSTEPSLLRSERTSRGHGTLRFTNDLSKVYVTVNVQNIDPTDVNMFHIHCGRPDMLGPFLVDFALTTDIQKNLADGEFSVELKNADIEKTAKSGSGLLGEFLIGCPIVPGQSDKVKTIGGMEYIARQGDLYFNLHTKGQTYYGNMRGQLKPAKATSK
jgi:hypothetical protein